MCKTNASMLVTVIKKPVPHRLKHPLLVVANLFCRPLLPLELLSAFAEPTLKVA